MTDSTAITNQVEPGNGMASRQGLRTSIREFFFAPEVPYGLALCRMVLPVILLYVVLRRWSHAREFFSTDGAAAPLADNYGYFNTKVSFKCGRKIAKKGNYHFRPNTKIRCVSSE